MYFLFILSSLLYCQPQQTHADGKCYVDSPSLWSTLRERYPGLYEKHKNCTASLKPPLLLTIHSAASFYFTFPPRPRPPSWCRSHRFNDNNSCFFIFLCAFRLSFWFIWRKYGDDGWNQPPYRPAHSVRRTNRITVYLEMASIPPFALHNDKVKMVLDGIYLADTVFIFLLLFFVLINGWWWPFFAASAARLAIYFEDSTLITTNLKEVY